MQWEANGGLIWDIIYLILKLHCSIVNPWNKKNLVGKNNFPKRTTMILKVTDKRGVDESQQKRRKGQIIQLNL